MKTRKIEHIFAPPSPHFVGDGFRVHNFIPGAIPQKRMDPFIMLDYNSTYYFAPSEIPKGVGVHPHRGFETVTIAYKGKVEHHDSAGGGGVISEGDVQWMTAASGVLHKEFHEKEWSKQGGEFQMVQLWVNLPAKDKMNPPKYQALENKAFPKVALPNNGGEVEVIAGEYEGLAGAASTHSSIYMLNARVNKGGKASFRFPAHFNTLAIVIEGNVQIDDKPVTQDHTVLFANEEGEIALQAETDAVILFLSGEPLNEPIVSYGPFVMNTVEQINEAITDYNLGKFGFLE